MITNLNQEEVIECDYYDGEVFELEEDAYFLTVAANITQDVSPIILNAVNKHAFMIFFLQFFGILAFMWEFRNLDRL